MVSLSKERMSQREIEVAHLISEEETIEQMTKVRSQTNVVVETQKTTAPPAVISVEIKDLKTELDKAHKETKVAQFAVLGAVHMIFVLLFIFVYLLGNYIDGHEVLFNILEGVTAFFMSALTINIGLRYADIQFS